MSEEINSNGKKIAAQLYGVLCDACTEHIATAETIHTDQVEKKMYHARCYVAHVKGRLVQINSILAFLQSREPGLQQHPSLIEVKKLLLSERVNLMRVLE